MLFLNAPLFLFPVAYFLCLRCPHCRNTFFVHLLFHLHAGSKPVRRSRVPPNDSLKVTNELQELRQCITNWGDIVYQALIGIQNRATGVI